MLDLPLASIGSLYERAIVDTGREAEFLFFVAFLLSWAFIRTSAHLIRAQVRWWPGNVQVGGTHVHHLVWGIVTMMVTGYVGVTIAPPSPWHEIIAASISGMILVGFTAWIDLVETIEDIVFALVGFFGFVGIAAAVVNLAK